MLERRTVDERLAEERSYAWERAQQQAADAEQDARDSKLAPAAVQVELVDGSEPVQEDPGEHEQGALREPVTEHIRGHAGDAVGGEESDPAHEHADVADRRERQQPLEVALRVTHDRAPQRGHRPERDENHAEFGRVGTERAGEDRPVQPRDCVHAKLGHHAGEQDADRGRRHGMRIGEPEVDGDRRGLRQEAGEQEHHRHDHECVGPVTIEGGADLRHIERAGPGIQQRQADEDRVCPHAVGDREVDRALDRPALLDPVRGQRVGDRAHQLEEHRAC